MLELRGLTRRYGDVVALDGLGFDVPPGEVVGFLGPNGAGKTTTMRAVFGITSLDEGDVLWRGRPVGATERLRFGYMPEERGLYPNMVVREQLVYLGRLHGMTKAAALAAADRWLATLGLEDRASARLEALSLGNQQRIQLAAAMVHEPELLVLDEPFSGLDPVGVDVLGAVLAARADAGAAVLFSSHQLDLVEHLCSSVAIVDHGRLVVSGTVDELTTARRRLVVEVGGMPGEAWLGEVSGVRVSDRDGPRLRLDLAEGVDSQDVLAAALRAGPVAHFAFERRRLSEVFREAVRRP